VALGEWPIVVANAVTLALAATILGTKIVVDRRRGNSPGGGADQNR
jgi:MtN3 and saliva related transmembrane protein